MPRPGLPSNVALLLAGVGGVFFGIGCREQQAAPAPAAGPAKIYVAVQDDSALVVLDPGALRITRTIILGHLVKAHGLAVAPDGKSVWVTLRYEAPAGDAGADHDMAGMGFMGDGVAVVDPSTDKLVATVDLGTGSKPAHLAFAPDSRTVFVTAGGTHELVAIDVASHTVSGRAPLGAASGPDGIVITPAGIAWIADGDGRSAVRVENPPSGATRRVSLDGAPLQATQADEGRVVFMTLWDARRVARIDTGTSEVKYLDLPAGSQAPGHMWSTPDGKTLLVADGGAVGGRPDNDKLYLLDVAGGGATATLQVGPGVHGIAAFGDRAWVTGGQDGSVTAVDLVGRKVVGSTKVGRTPSGIGVWAAGQP